MNVERFGHITDLGRFQKSDQIFDRGIFMMMAGIARIGLFFKTACLQTGRREHESEGVAVCISGLPDGGDFGHVAAHTAPEGVDAMNRTILDGGVAAFAELVFEQPGFGTDDNEGIRDFADGLEGALASMDIVAGNAGHADLRVFALLPVKILLIAVS
jgi:hypothetical protein